MSNEHTVKSYEEELRHLIDSVIKMGSLTESQMAICDSVRLPILITESIKCLNSSSYDFTVCSLLIIYPNLPVI